MTSVASKPIMLCVVMLNVVMPSVVMLSVAAPAALLVEKSEYFKYVCSVIKLVTVLLVNRSEAWADSLTNWAGKSRLKILLCPPVRPSFISSAPSSLYKDQNL
jgi:chromate transport protein ChrA